MNEEDYKALSSDNGESDTDVDAERSTRIKGEETTE